ncbi:MAG: FAD-binding oxidoreductase, partial [Patescibacteria group bacterium]
FEMMHGSFGTLGIISKLTFGLTEAKPFVHLTFERYGGHAQFVAAIRHHYERRDADFMDGIIHGRDQFVLCIGNFVDSAPYQHSYERGIPYYKAARERVEDYLSTYDYFFRYDSDCHWIARNYGLENPILRRLFGKLFLSSTKLLTHAKQLGFLFKNVKPDVIVDVFVPFSRFTDFWSFYEREFNYFPVWIVPYKIARRYPWIADDFLKGVDDELFIDLAIYGMRQRGRNYYKLLEDELLRVQGTKTLISHNYYDEETFWKIYNKENYRSVKQKMDPNNIFRDLYKKTHRL